MKGQTTAVVFTIMLMLGASLSISSIDQAIKDLSKGKSKANQNLLKNKDNKYVAKLLKNGYSRFGIATKVEFVQKIPKKNINDYAGYLANKLKVPKKMRAQFIEDVKITTILETNDWKELDIMFSTGNGGRVKTVQFVASYNSKSKTFDIFSSDITATFAIADDVFVSTYKKKILWGLSSTTKLSRQNLPADLTPDVLGLMFDFFRIVTFERFAKFRGIKF